MNAAAAGLQFRELHRVEQMEQATALFTSIWQTGSDRPLIEPALLTALAHAGNYVVGVFEGTEMIAACVGFFGAPVGQVLHSHIAGVRPDQAGRGIGLALKLHQRQWALARGLSEITWTFDPLVSRNAYFNLVKLGAGVQEYLVDFYGTMYDGVNAGQPSDRMMARWPLVTPLPNSVTSRTGYATVLQVAADGQPARQSETGSAERLAIGVPSDIEALRSEDPVAAIRWRHELRRELGERLRLGWRISGFDKNGFYLLVRN